MANITTYNAKECIVTINGVNITGLGEDMITWEKEEAFFEPVVGAQGDVVKSEINNSLYTLTIAVQPTSPQLGHLINLQNQSEAFPVSVINKALGVRLGGSMANVSEAPEFSLGAEAEDLEFAFMVFDGYIESTSGANDMPESGTEEGGEE
ncbi:MULTISPECIES: hypothetical protein [Congzhengia]|jgi:hypothetical protein|uniref:DUF3277 domain-containing protein n=1 Tax=Congzhengia minquanensis TaxID=2763657 RepID=A0A926DQ88_9FIRM|nr:hypothetical protein [Congzhengia minquanensis]MBC8541837.1 DUF3277 domain-containing protein [Congzhengia minquanensis]MBD8947112.1 DUF3277 domain-containing protein [Clostridiales bacterium]